MSLSEETKKSIERIVGLPFEDIVKMDILHEKAHVEKKIGKKIGWWEGQRIDGLAIRTMEEVDKRMSKILEEDEEER